MVFSFLYLFKENLKYKQYVFIAVEAYLVTSPGRHPQEAQLLFHWPANSTTGAAEVKY